MTQKGRAFGRGRTTVDVILVASFTEGLHLRQRGTVPAETLIESVASVLAGNVNGLRIKKIEATDAARNVDGYERAMDALRARRAVVSHGRR